MSTAKSPTVLVTVTKLAGAPDLRAAAQQLGVKVEDIDASFGLIPIDVAAGTYCVQVISDRLPAGFEQRKPYQGPFADVGIAAFGQVRDKKDSGK